MFETWLGMCKCWNNLFSFGSQEVNKKLNTISYSLSEVKYDAESAAAIQIFDERHYTLVAVGFPLAFWSVF